MLPTPKPPPSSVRRPYTLQTWITLAILTPAISHSSHRSQLSESFRIIEQQILGQQQQQRTWDNSFPPDAPRLDDIPPPPAPSDGRRMVYDLPEDDRTTYEKEHHGGRRRLDALDVADGKSWSGKLRKDLLADYDRGAYPWEHVWSEEGWVPPVNSSDDTVNKTETLRKGVPIKVGINYHRVFAVDIVNSFADIVIWFRLSWDDPRLTWNPDDYGGIERVYFWIHEGSGPGGEMSEVWTPDLELWNQETSLTRSMTDSHAVVDFDGSVWWSRPGHLRVVCNFEGLDKFPFDLLTCTAEVGSWAYSGLYLRPTLMDEGFSIGGSDTAGEAYAEYKLEDVVAIEHIYPPYPAAPEEDWPVIKHRISFRRAWQPYTRGYLMLQIILNLAAMACFWLPPHCGERMGLSITALLAAVTSDLVVSKKLPSASEMTWVSSFSIVSLIFGALVLFESAIVLYFYYLTADNLTPNWWIWIREHTKRLRMKGKIKRAYRNHDDDESAGQDISDDFDDNDAEGNGRSDLNNYGNRMPRRQTNQTEQSESMIQCSSTNVLLGRDAGDFLNQIEMENNLYWQRVGEIFDEVSRVVFPLAYSIALGVMLAPVEFKAW